MKVFLAIFCLMIEGSGSGSGSKPPTNGSGSRGPKNVWIRWIRIRIRIRNTENTVSGNYHYYVIKHTMPTDYGGKKAILKAEIRFICYFSQFSCPPGPDSYPHSQYGSGSRRSKSVQIRIRIRITGLLALVLRFQIRRIRVFSAFRILIHEYEIRLQILLSSNKNSEKNIDSYCFVTFYDFLSLKSDVNVASKRKQKNQEKNI